MVIYNFLLVIAPALIRLVALFDRKLSRFRSLRIGEIDRVRAAFSSRPDKPVLWFHAASAGEFEQAKPLIEALNGADPSKRRYFIAASFFSPSGYDAGAKYDGVDFIFNLPLDRKRNAVALLDAIRPHALIYAKYDVWINLSLEASRRGVRTFLISGTLPEKSLRHRFPVKMLLRKTYASLTAIYAISEPDAERFRSIAGDRSGLVSAAGDTRFDRVLQVIESRTRNPLAVIEPEQDAIYLLAGSTYAVSERALLNAFATVSAAEPRLRLVLVPHEIDPENIERLCREVRARGLQPVRYSQNPAPLAFSAGSALIVDAFGILAFLYRQADIVFVGGSYKGSVHSVLEPAVFGRPIITGPYIKNSFEALTMAARGDLLVCPGERELAAAIARLSSDTGARADLARRSRAFFENNTGATKNIVSKIEGYL